MSTRQLELMLMQKQRGAGDRQERVLNREPVVMSLSVEPTAATCDEQITGRWCSGALILAEALDERGHAAEIDQLIVVDCRHVCPSIVTVTQSAASRSPAIARNTSLCVYKQVAARVRSRRKDRRPASASSFARWCDAEPASSADDGRPGTAELASDDPVADLGVAACQPVAILEFRRPRHDPKARDNPRRQLEGWL